jgi:formylglycine-generating enzyme required for sulfatase activity
MRGRALLIATSRYTDKALRALSSALVDVAGLEEVLADPRIGDFDVSTCVDAPWQEWLPRIEGFFSRATRDELLLLYISGHGVKDREGRLYFAATDTSLSLLLSTAISASFIHEVSSNSRSRRILMILDTCFSGAFAKGIIKSDVQAVNAGEYFSAGAGRVVITASNAYQYALAGDSRDMLAQPSLLSRHIIHGLRTGEADTDGDGQVSSEDLIKYVEPRMAAEGELQRPQRWVFGLEGDLIVALNPAPPAAALPQAVARLMQGPLEEMRLMAVPHLERLLADPSAPMALAARQALERLRQDASAAVAGAAVSILEKRPPVMERTVPSSRGARIEQRAQRAPAAHLMRPKWATAIALIALLAVAGIAQYRSQPAASWLMAASASVSGHAVGDTFLDCSGPFCPAMVVIPPGRFQMGSLGHNREVPVHEVTIGYAFAVGKYPITRGQWRAYLAASGRSASNTCYGFNSSTGAYEQKPADNWQNPGFPQEDSHPVVCVTWNEAQDFATWLSQKTGHHYRLLSEAEYEYINRAGTSGTYFWGDTDEDQCLYANGADAPFKARYGWDAAECYDGYLFTSPVGSFKANGFRLYDTTGNVWSWTQDCWNSSYRSAPVDGSAWMEGDCDLRAVRGGSSFNDPKLLRAAFRVETVSAAAGNDLGFRIARTD